MRIYCLAQEHNTMFPARVRVPVLIISVIKFKIKLLLLNYPTFSLGQMDLMFVVTFSYIVWLLQWHIYIVLHMLEHARKTLILT